jgi:hypothetical protein
MSGLPESPPTAAAAERPCCDRVALQSRVGLLLRVVGIADCLAITVAVLPWSMIEQAHWLVGTGELPREPTVEYLVRSVSILHAMFGALLVLLSRDVARYADLIRGLGKLACSAGILLLVIDLQSAVPLWWATAQCGGLMAIGLFLVASLRATRPSSGGTIQ